MNGDSSFFSRDDLVYSYTRAQAIADGVLVDVSETAREAGIRFPAAVTARLWHGYIVPREDLAGAGQSVEGRLWDALFLFAISARKFSGDTLFYDVLFLMDDETTESVRLKAVCGPGDEGEPVITIMLPDED